MPNVKTVQVCKRACSLSHWQKASPQALFIVVTGGYARNIERKRSVKTRTLTKKLLGIRESMREDLVRIRTAFERIDKSNLPVTFNDFPRGSCGDTCEVLAEILRELGHGSSQYKVGCRENGNSHAWLEMNSVIIDITADQFDEISDPVYIGPSNPWYQSFEIQQEHEAGYSRLDARSKAELAGVHSRVKEELNA